MDDHVHESFGVIGTESDMTTSLFIHDPYIRPDSARGSNGLEGW